MSDTKFSHIASPEPNNKFIFYLVPTLGIRATSEFLRGAKKLNHVCTRSICLQLPEFTGENFDNWYIQLTVFLISQDLWNLVENGYTDIADSKVFEALSKE